MSRRSIALAEVQSEPAPNAPAALLTQPGAARVTAAKPTARKPWYAILYVRSEEHTSELQSRPHLVCRLLLEKKKKTQNNLIYQKYESTKNKIDRTILVF